MWLWETVVGTAVDQACEARSTWSRQLPIQLGSTEPPPERRQVAARLVEDAEILRVRVTRT